MAYWVLWPIYTHSHRVFLITESVLKCNNLSNLLGCVSRNSPCLIGFHATLTLDFGDSLQLLLGDVFWRLQNSMASSNGSIETFLNLIKFPEIFAMFDYGVECFVTLLAVFLGKCFVLVWVQHNAKSFRHTTADMSQAKDAGILIRSVNAWSFPCFVKSFWRSSIWDASPASSRPRNPSPSANAMTTPNVLESWPDGWPGGIWNWLKDYRGFTKTVGQGKPKLTIGGTTPHSIVVQITTTLAEGLSQKPIGFTWCCPSILDTGIHSMYQKYSTLKNVIPTGN